MILKDYEIDKSKILEFLHGLKYAGPEIIEFLQVNVSEIILFVFSYSFFHFSDFKFSTQVVSTLTVTGIILFEVSWPHFRSILLQWCCDSILMLVYVRGLLLLSNLEIIG